MKKLILLLIICVITSIIVSCDFNAARDALAKTFETIGGDKETNKLPSTGDENPFNDSITDLIREENKTITGNSLENTQWIEMYKTQLFGDKEISEINLSDGFTFSHLSDYFSISVVNFDVTFIDGSTDKLSVIDTNQDGTRTLVDIIYYESLPELFDNDFIYELMRSDSRFAAKMKKDINNVYPDNTVEIDIAKIVPQYHSDYNLSSAVMKSDNVIEIVLNNLNKNEIILEYDYVEHMIISENERSFVPDTMITNINSPDGKHNAYIDKNLYVRDIDTNDIWLIHEHEEDVSAFIEYVYKDKLIYSISNTGFGIYDFKSKENTVYLDEVSVVGLQNGVLFLDGSDNYNEDLMFTIDLNSNDYKITDISNHAYTYIPANASYAIRTEANGDEIKVKLYNTLNNMISSEYQLILNNTGIRDIGYYNNKLIIICPKYVLGHDYIYITDIS